jgi:hypothetical protein
MKDTPYAEWYYNTARVEGSPTQQYDREHYGADHDASGAQPGAEYGPQWMNIPSFASSYQCGSGCRSSDWILA